MQLETKMPAGPLKGKVLNTVETRSSRYLEATELEKFGIEPSADWIAVANFKHDSRYWVALLPKTQILRTIVQHEIINLQEAFNLKKFAKSPVKGVKSLMKHLPLAIDHLQLRFQFNENITLVDPQSLDRVTIPGDAIFYTTRAQVAGEKADFNPVASLRDQYAVGYPLGSEEEFTRRPLIKGHLTKQWELPLDAAESLKLLELGLEYSTRVGLSEMYHLLENTCNNFTFFILDKLRGRKPAGRPSLKRADNLAALHGLKIRGFDTKKLVALPSVQEEHKARSRKTHKATRALSASQRLCRLGFEMLSKTTRMIEF